MKDDLIYEGIDLKNILKLRKFEILKSLQVKERVEIKSRHLFISRVKRDLLIYTIKRRTQKEMIELMNSYRKETKFYTKPQELLNEIDELQNILPEVIGRSKELLDAEIDRLDFMRKTEE